MTVIFPLQLYLNGVSYGKMISPDRTSVLATGLAGGRNYDVMVKAFPKNKQLQPHSSNIVVRLVMINCFTTAFAVL